MSRRRNLISLASAFAILTILGIGYFLLASLAPTEAVKDGLEVVITPPPLVAGELQTIKVGNRNLFVLRPNGQQREAIRTLDGFVYEKQTTSYSSEIAAYAFWGVSSRNPYCELQHYGVQPSRLLDAVPNALWLGGFWDPNCEVSYDYAGRAITQHEFTFNGYNVPFPNLKPAQIRVRGDTWALKVPFGMPSR